MEIQVKKRTTGMQQYEKALCGICNVQEVTNAKLRKQELESCIGVAMVMSYIEGVDSTIESLSNHLEINSSWSLVFDVFTRLKINGIFSERYDARNDKVLNREIRGAVDTLSTGDVITGDDLTKNAWGIIAGISCGVAGIKNSID
jgi:hypothetical protein